MSKKVVYKYSNPVVLTAVKVSSRSGVSTDRVVRITLKSFMGYVVQYWFLYKKRVNINGDFQSASLKAFEKTIGDSKFKLFLAKRYGLTNIERFKEVVKK